MVSSIGLSFIVYLLFFFLVLKPIINAIFFPTPKANKPRRVQQSVPSDGQAEDRNDAVHCFILPPDRARAIRGIVPVTRTGGVKAGAILLHNHTSYWKKIKWHIIIRMGNPFRLNIAIMIQEGGEPLQYLRDWSIRLTHRPDKKCLINARSLLQLAQIIGSKILSLASKRWLLQYLSFTCKRLIKIGSFIIHSAIHRGYFPTNNY